MELSIGRAVPAVLVEGWERRMWVEANLGYIVISRLSWPYLKNKQNKNTTKVLLALSKGYMWASLLAQGSLCTATAELPSSLAICWSSSTHSHTSSHRLPATGNREHNDSCGIWTWSFLHLGSMQWLQKAAAIFPVEKAFHARERGEKDECWARKVNFGN